MFRRITLRSLAASLLALLALGTVSQAQAQTPVRIMPLGDSITSSPGCWRAYLWGLLRNNGYTNIDFVGSTSDGGSCSPGFTYDQQHEGHSGFAITGIADANQLPPWLSGAQPDIVVMHLGTNDMWGGWIPLETKITALTKLIGQMRAYKANIKIVVARIIPMNADGCTTCMADVIAFNNALTNVAASLSNEQSPIYLVDQWTGFDVVADTYDRVHPVTSGFIKMADRFYPAVAAVINQVSSQVHLTIVKQGTGTGTVTSNTGGINCGAICGANYSNSAPVTLTAAAASGSTFAGWSGACSGSASTCTVSMDQAKTANAMFNVSGTTSYWLTTTRSGTGSGTITTSPAGLNCGSTCSAVFIAGTSVTITATPGFNSVYTGGLCGNPCTVTMDQARAFAVNFTSTQQYTVSVSKNGTGSGTVVSTPAGINCGSTCSASWVAGTYVELTATPAAGSTFAGWNSECVPASNPVCVPGITATRNLVATFNASTTTNYSLSVTKAGTGSGVVTSQPSGINCGSSCSASFASGVSVTLTAAAASNTTFAGWSGACSGTGACTVSMSQARSVTATFNPAATFALTVTKAGTGAGTVASSPAGINCGSTCAANYGGNASVTLTATASSGSAFAGWSGACSGTGSCVVTMNQARAVTATFNTSGGTGGTCQNPITFTGNSGNFNTAGAVCYRTNANVNGWGCYNFDGRTLTVGGVARICGQLPLTRSADGYYYFSVTAGQFPWAGLFAW